MLRELPLLLPYARRYWKYFAFGFACIVGALALKVLIPRWLGQSIDEIGTLGETGGESVAAARAAIERHALWIVGAAAAAAVVRTASRLSVLGVSRRAVHDVREDLFAHLTRLAPSFFERTPTGHLMSRCVNDVQNVQGLLGPVFLYTVETVVLYAVVLTVMVGIDPVLTVVGVLPFPLFLVYAQRQALRIHQGSRAAQAKLGAMSAKVDESLSGQHVIKTLTLEDHDRRRFEGHCGEYRDLNLDVARARAAILPAMILLGSVSVGVVIAVGGPRVMSGELTLGRFVQMMIYLQMLAQPTGTLGFVISSFQRGSAALARLREVLEFEPALRDPERPRTAPAEARVEVRALDVVHEPPSRVPHLSGTLPDVLAAEARRVLEGISFTVEPGETVGITGPTGSGKTTLLKALARQLEIPRGHVFYGGVDAVDLRLADVRRTLGYVPQETFLFGRTLSENVALGNRGAAREEIERAVRAARLEEDLPQLPRGLDTLLGERGVNLSGGQRQRTALARVLLLDPRIVLLDDALSAVDTHTATEILKELREKLAGRTAIVVSHRLAHLVGADRILFLEHGSIVESGTHAELMELDGRYAALYRKQEIERAFDAQGEGAA